MPDVANSAMHGITRRLEKSTMDMMTEKSKSISDQVIERVAALVATATEADREFVKKIRQPGFFSIAATVTPVQAALILEDNKHNRRLSNAQFNTIMGILMRGEWKRTHQGVAFYDDGTLMDGQHRLGSSVITGIPLTPIMISGGYSKEDNDAIDCGGVRKAPDAAALAGVADATTKCAIVEAWMKYDHLLRYGTGVNFTNHQIKVKAIEHDQTLARAITLAEAIIKACTLGPMTKKEIASRAFEMEQGGWSQAYIHTLLMLVNQGTADYEGAPTVYLSDAYSKDRDEKAKFKLTGLQRQAMWHKVAGLYSHKAKVAKSAVMWKSGAPIPGMSPPADLPPNIVT
jgi:hypothetical protein